MNRETEERIRYIENGVKELEASVHQLMCQLTGDGHSYKYFDELDSSELSGQYFQRFRCSCGHDILFDSAGTLPPEFQKLFDERQQASTAFGR